MSKDTGGPAFARAAFIGGGGSTTGSPGMTLRDYFAAKALPKVWDDWKEFAEWSKRNECEEDQTHFDEELFPAIASDSYAMADAMLAERDE